MARPQDAVQDGIQGRRVASSVLTKQSETPEKRWCSRVGAGRGTNNLHCEKLSCCESLPDIDKTS